MFFKRIKALWLIGFLYVTCNYIYLKILIEDYGYSWQILKSDFIMNKILSDFIHFPTVFISDYIKSFILENKASYIIQIVFHMSISVFNYVLLFMFIPQISIYVIGRRRKV
jgi:hypothetical protein